MRYKGRCSGWLRCCDPRDPRPSDQCKKRHLKTARKLALESLANAKSNGSQPLTLMEFHWPDSGLGWPHGALTFLDLVPMMRALPCRTVLVTVLRAPADLCARPGYPPHAMALLTHTGCALVGRHFASPRRMAHIGARRISADIPLRHMAHIHTSWAQLDGLRLRGLPGCVPESASPSPVVTGVDTALAVRGGARDDVPKSVVAAGKVRCCGWHFAARPVDAGACARIFTSCPISFPAIADAHDVAVQLVCAVAGIAPCPALKQVDDAKRGRLARDCIAPSAEAARGVMERHALADERLHTYAMARLDTDWQALRAGAARLPIQAPTPTGHTDAAALAAGRPTPCGLVLFLHLEKTGGSTMVKMFEELEKRNELLFFNQACGWPQFASQLMERFRSELGLPYGSNGRRRLDRLMRPDSWMALPPGGKCSSGPHIQRGPHFEPMPFAAPPAFHQLPGSARTPLIICILHF